MKNLISKISCFIILVLIVISLFSLYVYSENDNLFIGQTGSPSGSTLYNSTNTFYYNGDNQFYVTSNPEDEMSMAARTYTYYNVNSATNIPVYSGNPQITVLTHGLGGNAYHWSNDGTNSFAYDSIK